MRGERRGAKISDDWVEKPLAAAVLQIAQRSFGERAGSATTVDGLGENFGLALRADFFGELLSSVPVLSSMRIPRRVPRMIQWGDLGRRTMRMGMAVPHKGVGSLRG